MTEPNETGKNYLGERLDILEFQKLRKLGIKLLSRIPDLKNILEDTKVAGHVLSSLTFPGGTHI